MSNELKVLNYKRFTTNAAKPALTREPASPSSQEDFNPTKINPEDPVELRRLLAQTRRKQELYFDTIADAAITASEQVQSVQIEMLQQAPETSWSAVFMEIALSLLMGGGVVSAVVKAFTKTALESVLRTRAAFSLVSKSSLGHWLNQALKYDVEIGNLSKVNAIHLSNSFLQSHDIRVLYSDFVNQVIDADYLALGQRVAGPIMKQHVNPALKTLDRPGPAIIDFAQNFARRQKFAQNLILDIVDIEIQSGKHNGKAMRAFYSFLKDQARPDEKNIESIKIAYSRYFEFCIWVMLHSNVELVARISQNIKQNEEFSAKGLRDPLTKYLVHRLPPLANMEKTFIEVYPPDPKMEGTYTVVDKLSEDWNSLSAQIKNQGQVLMPILYKNQ